MSLCAGSSCFPTTRIKSDISLSAYKLAILVTTWKKLGVVSKLSDFAPQKLQKYTFCVCVQFTSLELSMSITGEGTGSGLSDEP